VEHQRRGCVLISRVELERSLTDSAFHLHLNQLV